MGDPFAVGPNQTSNDGTFTPMSFTHDNNLPPVVAASLGLWNSSASPGVYPLSLTKPDPNRELRSSYLVAFRGYVALEGMSCTRVREKRWSSTSAIKDINGAPVPVPGCSSGPGSTCPLQRFLEYVMERGIASGDFVQTCGLQVIANATSVTSFLTTAPDPGDIEIVSL
ncbi:hypothetical protein D9615_006256 [Tricholomella constricta]|uniref:Uncharacterized protein n=1 Tax=Tricholomella constricta TaxID=117010 RepID=A0A8H5HB83_9AGAR|nr:hypothetical protein D9615_006256 [Tricholomella constricta]